MKPKLNAPDTGTRPKPESNPAKKQHSYPITEGTGQTSADPTLFSEADEESQTERFLRDLRSAAISVAGHAVVLHAHGFRCLMQLSRNDTDMWEWEKAVLGNTCFTGAPTDDEWAEVCLAGLTAETIALGEEDVEDDVFAMADTTDLSPTARDGIKGLDDHELYRKIEDVRRLLDEHSEQHGKAVAALLQQYRENPDQDLWEINY